MSYSNRFLRDFRPVFLAILKEKAIDPAQLEVEIIDEEPDSGGIFEPTGVREVLEQLGEELNFLTIYTERPAYFFEFAETMYEENGLVVMIFPKKRLQSAFRYGQKANSKQMRMCSVEEDIEEKAWFMEAPQLVLDFEWGGSCYFGQMRPGRYYIPIHKKPWKTGENLDIIIPIGYNTVIVKDMQNKQEKPGRDRFDEAFYNS